MVPLATGAHADQQGAFVILEFVEEPVLVFIENHGTGLFLEEEADLAAYRLAFGDYPARSPCTRCNDRADHPDRHRTPLKTAGRVGPCDHGRGARVEVAVLDGAVAVRDSKHSTGGTLSIPLPIWAAFTTALRANEFG